MAFNQCYCICVKAQEAMRLLDISRHTLGKYVIMIVWNCFAVTDKEWVIVNQRRKAMTFVALTTIPSDVNNLSSSLRGAKRHGNPETLVFTGLLRSARNDELLL